MGADLTIDEGVAGFHGNTIAPVSELHLEKYGRAADLVARQAAGRLPAILPCDPARTGEAACARQFVTRFGRRAFRRPLTADEVSSYEAAVPGRPARGGLRHRRAPGAAGDAAEPALPLPDRAHAGGGGAGDARCPPFALATRLAYFLWNSTPDEALLAAAEANRLSTRADVAAQVKRMMADRRFGDTLSSFHLQWLDLTELGSVEKRNKIYPLFTHELRAPDARGDRALRRPRRPRGRRPAGHPAGGAVFDRRRQAVRAVRPGQARGRRGRLAAGGSGAGPPGRAADPGQRDDRPRPLGQVVAGAAGQADPREAVLHGAAARRRPT